MSLGSMGVPGVRVDYLHPPRPHAQQDLPEGRP